MSAIGIITLRSLKDFLAGKVPREEVRVVPAETIDRVAELLDLIRDLQWTDANPENGVRYCAAGCGGIHPDDRAWIEKTWVRTAQPRVYGHTPACRIARALAGDRFVWREGDFTIS